MSQFTVKMCWPACVLVSLLLISSGTLHSGYNCNQDCRERKYWWVEIDGGQGFEEQVQSCLYCTQYRCADYDPPKAGSCKATDLDQFWRFCNTNAICSFSNKEVVEANPVAGTGKYEKTGVKVYICLP